MQISLRKIYQVDTNSFFISKRTTLIRYIYFSEDPAATTYSTIAEPLNDIISGDRKFVQYLSICQSVTKN